MPRGITLRPLHVADLLLRHRQVALPPDIVRVRLSQTLGNRERGLIAHPRRGYIALRPLHVADLRLRYREVTLHRASPGSACARRSLIASEN